MKAWGIMLSNIICEIVVGWNMNHDVTAKKANENLGCIHKKYGSKKQKVENLGVNHNSWIWWNFICSAQGQGPVWRSTLLLDFQPCALSYFSDKSIGDRFYFHLHLILPMLSLSLLRLIWSLLSICNSYLPKSLL